MVWIATALLACCADKPVTTIALPHAPRPGEAVSLEVRLGSLARGNKVEISTSSGRFLGVISPFGTRSGRESETYIVPVPADAVSGDHISLRILIDDGKQKRAPASNEIRSIVAKVSSPSGE